VPLLAYYYVAAVVPDEAAEGLAVQTRCASYDLKDGEFDVYGLHEALSYTVNQNGYTFERCDYVIKEYSRLQSNSISAVFIIGALYTAVVFVFMCMAILALKTLSGLSEDRQRYAILFRLGTGEQEQSKTLFLQTFSFFFLPFALPMLLSFPAGIICSRLMELAGYAAQVGEVLTNTILIAAAMTVFYVLYFNATYLIAKRNISSTNI
jgi:putative ABC transport system permease protein